MQHFRYKALKSDGTVIEASGEADSRVAFIASLKGQGLVVVGLDQITPKRDQYNKVPRTLISRFYVMLGNQLQVGVPIISALQVIERQERSPAGKRLIGEIVHRIESGQTLSAAMEAHPELFSIVDLNLLRAGEEGGFLPDAIDRIAFIRQWQQKLIGGAWGAAAYPLVLIAIAMLLIPAMLIYLAPKLEPIFASLRRDGQLPLATSVLLSVSHLSSQYGFQILAAIVISVVAITALVPASKIRIARDCIVLRIPLVGDLVRDFILARFFRILGTLLQNKIQIVHSLNIAINILGNAEMAKAFRPLPDAISSGKRLAESLDQTGSVPSDILAMVGVAEQSNSLDSVLAKIAEQLEFRTNRRLELAVKLIEPLLLLVMAAFVGFVVLALLLPIFEGQTLG